MGANEHMVPSMPLSPPAMEVLYLSNLDDFLAVHACPDPACLLGQGQVPLAPPCGHISTIGTWHVAGRLWLGCTRCYARLAVAVRRGVVEQGEPPSTEAEGATTLCGHAPYGMVVYKDGWVTVFCWECRTRWSRWEIAAYVPDALA